MNEINNLFNEDVSLRQDCNLCKESPLDVGQKSEYGSIIVYKIGDANENRWFATLSPKTGSDPEKDFTIQLMPFAHLTHFSQINNYPELAKNYGIAFAKISSAITKIMAMEKENFKASEDFKENATSIATYGKSTNWKEKKEHLHIKLFPFRGNIGQPYTVDSSFGRKEIHKDQEGKEFVKMTPVKKNMLSEERFNKLSNLLISLLK